MDKEKFLDAEIVEKYLKEFKKKRNQQRGC